MMRLKLILSGVILSPTLILAGCGMNTTSGFSSNVMSPAVSGRAFGGQQPISGATISVVAMGTTGYGSQGTVLASTTTDNLGNFSFAPGAYDCPQPDTPVYLLAIGGDPGIGSNNPAIVNAAGLGTCTAGKSSYTVVNEVTTAALAYALAHFFSPTLGGANASNDWFGGPSTTVGGTIQYSTGLVEGNSYTIPAMVSNAVGAPNQPNSNSVVDVARINSIANSLAACVNSSGGTGQTDPCGKLFLYTTPPGSTTAPTDTLQAAVQMALYPYQNVTAIYNLATPQPPFVGLTSSPLDWTVSVSYMTPTLGLALNTGTVSTLDIDRQGKIWFPSNVGTAVGAAYFDPASHTFNGPYNSTGLVHPQQVAIDGNGYAWYNDSANNVVPGYLTSAPNTTQTFSMADTLTDAVTIGDDNRVILGTDNGNYGLGYISADRSSYTADPSVNFDYVVVSTSGDAVGGVGLTAGDYIARVMQPLYVDQNGNTTQVVANTNALSGQVIFTGNDFVAVHQRSTRTGSQYDGLCIYSQRKCYSFADAVTNSAQYNNAPIGIAIDGASNLWVAESGKSAILQIIPSPGLANGAVYLNSSSLIPVHEYLHDSNNGGSMTKPAGIGVDAEGNVWVTNAGCIGTSCAPGSTFTLTQVVGAATPTVTPVSGQITGTNNLVGTEPTY